MVPIWNFLWNSTRKSANKTRLPSLNRGGEVASPIGDKRLFGFRDQSSLRFGGRDFPDLCSAGRVTTTANFCLAATSEAQRFPNLSPRLCTVSAGVSHSSVRIANVCVVFLSNNYDELLNQIGNARFCTQTVRNGLPWPDRHGYTGGRRQMNCYGSGGRLCTGGRSTIKVVVEFAHRGLNFNLLGTLGLIISPILS